MDENNRIPNSINTHTKTTKLSEQAENADVQVPVPPFRLNEDELRAFDLIIQCRPPSAWKPGDLMTVVMASRCFVLADKYFRCVGTNISGNGDDPNLLKFHKAQSQYLVFMTSLGLTHNSGYKKIQEEQRIKSRTFDVVGDIKEGTLG